MTYSMLRHPLLLTVLFYVVVPAALAQDDIRVERVQFERGANSAVVEGSITGYEIVDYVLGAREGQHMNVSMATDNTASYFNILAPGETEVAFFNGSVSENQYEGVLDESGDYKIRVYMMRSAARRNEVADHRLEIVISDAGEASSAGDAADSDAFSTGREARIWAPGEGDHFWVGPESKETLGSGGEFHIYVDPQTHPEALASFARFALGVGGSLPEHRHDKTEELAYFISGEGVARLYVDGEPRDIPVGPGHVWYNPPGVWHSVANTGDEPLVLVFATIPNEKKGLLSFFRRISVKPGEEPTVLPPEEFARIANEHDMILRPANVGNE